MMKQTATLEAAERFMCMYVTTILSRPVHTVGSHFRSLSVLLTSQSLYNHKTDLRTICLNASVFCLWPNFRDASALRLFTRQTIPEAPSTFLGDCLALANKKNTGDHSTPIYINTSNSFKYPLCCVVSHLLPDETLTVYRTKLR